MTPDTLETRLAGRPNSTTVVTVVDDLRADPDWGVTELTLEGQPQVIELLHRPSGTAYTLRRRGQALQRSEGG
jgi:hypothetical protein